MRSRMSALRKTTNCCLAVALSVTTIPAGAYAHGNSSPKIKSIFPSPTNRYMAEKPNICDQGSFFVGGMLKPTRYQGSSTPTAEPTVAMIGQMYVSFQIPDRYNSYPVIMVSGGGHTGAALESTPDAREGWGHYAVRKGIPTFIVDQSGRGRSGFDASVIHEGIAKLTDSNPANDAEGRAMIPNFLYLGINAWNFWFGHLVNPATGLPTGPGPASPYVDQLVPHGWSSRDPDPATIHDPGVRPQYPINAWTKESIPEGLIPKGEQLSKNFAGPDPYYLLNYYRQIVPNSEMTLPQGSCEACDQKLIANGGGFGPGHTWTPVAMADLIEGLGKSYGGAIVATHSQGGPIGHHLIRILKQRGSLGYLKGLITVEGTGLTLANAGISVEDFDKIPYMVLKGDYSTTSPQSQAIVDAIIARRKAGRGKAAVEYIKLDEKPNIANAWPAALKRPVMKGVTHMMMLGSDEGYGYDSTDIMDVILKWSDAHIARMKKTETCRVNNGHDHR